MLTTVYTVYVFCFKILVTVSAIASPTSVVELVPLKSAVLIPLSKTCLTASSNASASLTQSKDNLNMEAADKIVAIGFTLLAGKSGADPWQGS